MTPRPFTPRAYQQIIVDHIVRTPRCGVWAGMGLGKTASVLAALRALSLVEDVFPALVIAPLRVAQSTWPDEAEKWADFEDFKVTPIVGDIGQRRAALRYQTNQLDIRTINYENIPWLIETLNGEWPFRTVITDESTKLRGLRVGERTSKKGKKFIQGQGTKRPKALARIAHHKITRFIELTGTPAPNGLQDLWGQAWFLDAGQRLGRTFTAFSQRWFRPSYDGYGLEPLAHAQQEIEDRMRDLCVSLNAADYFDLQKPIENIVWIDLPPRARALYTEMEKRMFMELEGHEVEAFNAATKTMKCLQLANGAAYVDEKATEWREVHDEKIQALDDIIEEAAGMPVLVAYHFRSDLERLRKAFPKGRVLDKKPETIRQWNEGKIPVLFAHPASAGHGLNLQDGGNILVFFSLNWNLEEHQQIIERIGPTRQLQAGHNRPVFIHYIMARDTLDADVKTRLETKRDVQDILMEAMKARLV